MEAKTTGGGGETKVVMVSSKQKLRTATEESKKKELNRVPKQPEGTKKMRVPDGGWGWMVAFGAFLGSVLVLGQLFSFGVLFSQYLLSEDVSSTTTAWIYNISIMMSHIMMVLVGPLTQEFGTRTVGFCGVTICIASSLSSAFTPSPSFLYISTSLLGGVGPGLVISVCYTVVAPYFDKKKGRANTLLVAGSPGAQMMMVPLVRYLLEEYSFRGAALIYTGLLLHAYIGVSFFHPLEWHLKPSQEHQEETQEKLLPPDDDSPHSHLSKSLPSLVAKHTDGECVRPVQLAKRDELGGSCVSIASVDIPVGHVTFPSVASSLSVKESENVTGQTCGIARRLGNTFIRVGRSTLTNFKLYSSLRVCVIAFSFALSSASFMNFVLLVPFSMQASGHSLQDAAWCLAAMGAVNLLTRFIVSPLADCKMFDIRLCMMLGYLMKALSAVGFALCDRLVVLALWTVLFGVGLGATISLQILVIIAYMGIDLLPSTYGIGGITTAFLVTILGTLMGLVRDLTQSYRNSLFFVGALDFVSAALWVFLPAAVAWDTAKASSLHRKKMQHTDGDL